ncbi:MAG: hypothetical protein CM15mV15_0810 [uncultured marine virus]|nr:MAG: hypothetical protein CM15mV15_0810 [uncultured marine virus]
MISSRKRRQTYTILDALIAETHRNISLKQGVFFVKGSDFIFKCHNCGVGRTLGNFLKDNARDLYDQFVLERYKMGLTGKSTRVAEPKFTSLQTKPIFNTGTKIPKISDLNKEHPARSYLESRNINGDKLDRIFYAERFKEFVNKHKHTFDNLQNDSPRIIIPLIDQSGKWFGIQGRAISSNPKLRYITIIFDETKQKVFGLDTIDSNKTVYIVEGPFDSLFLENCVAMCGSDLDPRTCGWSDSVFVFDNEPRNKQITDRIAKAISGGYKVVIWNNSIKEKDVNDMILSGHNVQSIVESNTYSGLTAQVKFQNWKKV